MTAYQMALNRGTMTASHGNAEVEGTLLLRAVEGSRPIADDGPTTMPRTRRLAILFGLLSCISMLAVVLTNAFSVDVAAYGSMLTAAGFAGLALTMAARYLTRGRL